MPIDIACEFHVRMGRQGCLTIFFREVLAKHGVIFVISSSIGGLGSRDRNVGCTKIAKHDFIVAQCILLLAHLFTCGIVVRT